MSANIQRARAQRHSAKRPPASPLIDPALRQPSAARPVRCFTRSLSSDAHLEPHQHPWAQLTYCASGLMQVTVALGEQQTSEVLSTELSRCMPTRSIPQWTYIVPPSRALWIPPGVAHNVTVLETAEIRTVDIFVQANPPGWQQPRVLMVSTLLRELIHALSGSEPGARDDALMRLTLEECARSTLQSLGLPLPRDKRLRALCEAVLRAPGACATLAEWALDVGASERTVARLFRTELGTSYQQWRQQAVLAHALPLLARGTPVTQVALSCGYASDSAFCAMFKTAMGQSPSRFYNKN